MRWPGLVHHARLTAICISNAIAAAACISFAAPAAAAPDFIEINKARAAQGAINGSPLLDPPGYPVAITSPGNYRLTSPLDVADPNVSAIVVQADGVTIDLNGFTVSGAIDCQGQGAGVSCGGGSGIGVVAYVDATGDFVRGFVVRRGTVRGFGGGGILAGEDGFIEDVMASGNGAMGISVSAGSIVRGCIATRNGGAGILAGVALIERSVSRGNRFDGISGTYIAVRDVLAVGNGGDGVEVQTGPAEIVGLTAYANGGAGIAFPPDYGKGSFAASAFADNAAGSTTGLAVSQGVSACDGQGCP